METFSALLAICAGNSPVTGEFSTQRPVTQSFDDFFDLCLNKRLSKQSWGWWSETPSYSLWRHCNVSPWVPKLQFPVMRFNCIFYPRPIRAIRYYHALCRLSVCPPVHPSIHPSLSPSCPHYQSTAHNIQQILFIFGTAIDSGLRKGCHEIFLLCYPLAWPGAITLYRVDICAGEVKLPANADRLMCLHGYCQTVLVCHCVSVNVMCAWKMGNS